MRGVYYRTEKDGTPLATPELRISATNNRTVYYDNQNAKEAALQNGEIKEGSIVLTGYADGESEVLMKQELDWEYVQSFTAQQLFDGYMAPEDGVVYITGRRSGATASWITINHQKVGYYYGANSILIDCQVDSQINKGDVITSSNLLDSDYSGIFVPFKTVAEPLTLPVNVMNNPSLPDYSRAVAVSSLPYTAPGDGIIIGNCTRTTNGITSLFINGLVCARCDMNGSSYSSADLQLPVSKNDILTNDNGNIGIYLHFVPFKN